MKCNTCAGLRRISNGFVPDRPCPTCRTQFDQFTYSFKLWIWQLGASYWWFPIKLHSRKDFK